MADAYPKGDFREIPGLLGHYVTSSGEVWSRLKRGPQTGGFGIWRLRRSFVTRFGYLRLMMKVRGKQVNFHVHQLVLLAFVGPVPPGNETRHLNGIRTDNRLENLCYGTRIENVADRRLHGTFMEKERHHQMKVDRAKAAEILSARSQGKPTYATLASQFGLSTDTIGAVVRGEHWTQT